MSPVRIALMLLLPLVGWGDMLILKSGKEYTGVFVSGSARIIRFDIGRGVIRSFAIRDIDRLQFGAIPAPEPSVEVQPKADAAATAQPTMRASEAGPAPPQTAAAPAPAKEAPPKPPPPEPPPLTIPEVGTNTTAPLGDLGAIDSEYTARGSEGGVLGAPRAPTQPTADRRAVVRFYQNGAIYWTSAGGAHAIYGQILDAWMAAGGEHSKLGYPTGDEQDSNAAYNRRQAFEHGAIAWNPKDGAQVQLSSASQ